MRIERVTLDKKEMIQEAVDLSLINPLTAKYKEKKGCMIPLLQGAQNIYGYIPREVIVKISKETGLKLSDMYGVVTFYSQFRLNPVGKHIIKVCHGTACHVQNADAISDAIKDILQIEDGETTEDGLFTLESVACLGCCSLAPVMMVGDNSYGKLTKKIALKVIKDIKREEKNK